MKRFLGILILSLLCFITITDSATAFRLREIETIPKEHDSQYFGLSTGKLISHDNHSITIYNYRFQPSNKIELNNSELVLVAGNGLYYAIIDTAGYAEANQACYTIYNNRRQPLWSCFGAITERSYLSPNGDYLIMITGTPGHYDQGLTLIHKAISAVEIDIKFFTDILFADDGTKFIIDAGPKGAFLFSAKGEQVLGLGPRKYYAFGESSDFVAFYGNNKLELYKDAEPYWEFMLNKTRLTGISICESIDRVVLGIQSLFTAIDMKTGQDLFRYTPRIDGGSYTSVDVSADNRFIACGVDENKGSSIEKAVRHTTGFLYVYDIDGQIMEKLKFTYDDYAEGIPIVHFHSNSSLISVETVENIHIVELY